MISCVQTAVGSYWDKSKLSSSRLACRPRMFHWIKTDMMKARTGGYSASESPPPSTSSTPYLENIVIGSCVCGGGRFIRRLAFGDLEVDGRGWGSPWVTSFTSWRRWSISSFAGSWRQWWAGCISRFRVILFLVGLSSLTFAIMFHWDRGIRWDLFG